MPFQDDHAREDFCAPVPDGRRLALVFVLLALVACFNVFHRLGDAPIASWDEARHGVSAVEMLERGDYLISTYNGEPDYYNDKPPLAFYHAVAGFKIFGTTPFGLRFFSALSFILTAAVLFLFARKYRGTAFALLALGIFVTSARLIARHGARTGDADAVFVFLYSLALFLCLADGKGFLRYRAAAFVAGLAFLCKSFHSATLGISLTLLFLLEHGVGLRSLLQGLGCLACSALPVGIWVFFRMQNDGGAFFEQMFFNDVLDRFTTVLEGHNGSVIYYLIKILQNFPVWLGGLALVIGVFLRLDVVARRTCLAGQRQCQAQNAPGRLFSLETARGVFRVCDPVMRRMLLVVAVPFVLLTLSATKADWYFYPTYPVLSVLLAGAGFCFARRLLSLRPKALPLLYLLLAVCFLAQEAVVLFNNRKLEKERDRSQEIIREEAAQNPGEPLYLFVESKRGGWRQCLVLAAKLHAREIFLLPGGKRSFDSFSGGEKLLIYDEVPTPALPESSPGGVKFFPARNFSGKTVRNSIGMEFSQVPAGFGIPAGTADASGGEEKIAIGEFWLGKYEVTQEQWAAVMGNNPSRFKGVMRPVENVSLGDAREFIRRLNEREKTAKYRLPADMEWEYAARAGTDTDYFFGALPELSARTLADLALAEKAPLAVGLERRREIYGRILRGPYKELDDYAWFDMNTGGMTHPVGEKKPNPFGLYDIYGNVWEWVQNPSGRRRIFRGGSWHFSAKECGSSSRFYDHLDIRHGNIGFRLAFSPE
ncbi:MAG: SUMF1/EgtB/PvdO family nonheme iron enzyme [Desulfovibrio sp.]|jgi:formylglycine-generating enzyme required for sulfatase activity/4-amino-4-deoxy-L-arabinose transferase-like glycosyltransferase|nr:SUMF1/EgtB/PvdO family nonheme iron enzyme [Desulfovibrio sp.]